MAEISSLKNDSNSFIEENSFKEKNTSSEKKRKNSLNSSKSDSFFNNLNEEIKCFIENENDISFSSNSNSDCQEQQTNIDYLLDSKYWRVNKDLSIENENKNEKLIFSKKNESLFLNENEKEAIKLFEGKNKYKKDNVMISEGSNKQSTQGNEDEETRIDHLHNISDSESNNSPLNSLSNNESDENEINCYKLPNKNDKNNSDNENNEQKEKNNIDINKNNLEIKNLLGSNLLINGFNFTNDKIKLKNESEFVYPYEPINYMQNQNKNGSTPFFSGQYLNQPICSFNSNYNLPSPLSNRSIISFNSHSCNKMNNNYSENNEDDFAKNEKKLNINGQNNKFINYNINDYNKQINQNQKDIIDLPLIINQNNNKNIPVNYNCSKLNLNMTYYPKIQNSNISQHKQSIDKISTSSNYLPELNKKDISYNINTNNLSEKKIKNNNLNFDENTITNNMNNFNNISFNNKLKMNYKNIISNKSMNNIMNKSNLKGEKQILNLDDIVTGKDTRTTVMIRNIPIKYTDEILNEALVEFHGKYDCLYMPYDYEKNGNKGYAFINFLNPLHILYFYEKFNGKKWVHFESSKICELNCAHFQGVNEIQKHAKNFKDLKKTSYCNGKEEDMIIPSKYLLKLKKRFPKMQYTENKNKKILIIKSFE